MPAPVITAFGDADHSAGETGLTVDGLGFDPFADSGNLWIFENNDPNNPGLQDQLTFSGGHDQQLTGVEIPAVLNNVTGPAFLFFERIDGAFSDGFAFDLTAGIFVAVGTAAETDAAQALGRTKIKALPTAAETDAAQPIQPAKVYVLQRASEADVALPIAVVKQKAIGMATETDQALAIGQKVIVVGRATETDIALPISGGVQIQYLRQVSLGARTGTQSIGVM
jgi:hypothetical protein